MAFEQTKADRMNQLAQQYPGATLSTLATLARVPVSELGNYTNDSVGTRASNVNFGRVTSEQSQNTQSANTPRTGINPVTGRSFSQTPATPLVESNNTPPNINPITGRAFVPTPTPRPPVPQDSDVDFPEAYGESFREVTPIPNDTRFPATRTETVTQNTVDPGLANALRARERAAIEASNAFNEPPAPSPFPAPPPPRPVESFNAPVDDFSGFPVTQVDDFSGPTRNISQVDDFSGFPVTQVDDFGAPPRNISQVDDFSGFPVTQVDDFGAAPRNITPVDDFEAYGGAAIDFTDEPGADFDAFGNPVEPIVRNDGTSLVGDDPIADIGDGAEGDGIDGVEQAAISQQQQAAINAMALKQRAQTQQTVNEMREASGVKNADGDWRVKLRLAPQATYLYKDPNPGILAPLAVTDGIIFPYTPTIDIQYRAEYANYSPVHSNYQHYFYKGSSVQTVQMQAEFTAQDTVEAEYMLACIHFLKSASKMFYGQDAQRGSPPPLLYLSGLGEYQFNEQPCAVTEFNYNLPADVNYIRARSRHITRADNLQFQKPLATATTNGNFSALNRLRTAVTNALNGGEAPLQVGAKPFQPAPGNLGAKGATYVPTKMSMTINLLPIVSRKMASQQFSLKEYANGNLIKKGMW